MADGILAADTAWLEWTRVNRRRIFMAVGAVAGIAAAAALIVGGFRVYEELDARGKRPTFDPRWARCETGDRCVAVAAPCEDWAAVNERHRDDAAAYYEHLMTVIDATEMWCPSRSIPTITPFAFCLSGQCEFGPQ